VSELLIKMRIVSDAEVVLNEEVPDLFGLGGVSFILKEFTKEKQTGC
jgi:hypothetical protein